MNLETHWYRDDAVSRALLPLSWLFGLLAGLRRLGYRSGLLGVYRLRVPVIVVGNITVGGSGKTPLAAWLAGWLRRQGWRPGLISRGYGGQATRWPQQVRPDSDPVMVGDEAVLLARHCACPMAVGPDRIETARSLLEASDCDILISDDGLQHYALGRDIEIAVVDGERRLGNGRLLPAGPLREGAGRLARTDLVVANGRPGRHEFGMTLRGDTLVGLDSVRPRAALAEWRGRQVHAVAGIGHPQRFFRQLAVAGLDVIEHPFPDHHAFVAADLDFGDGLPVLMTEKDAVKCERLGLKNAWYLPVRAEPDENLAHRLKLLLQRRVGRLPLQE